MAERSDKPVREERGTYLVQSRPNGPADLERQALSEQVSREIKENPRRHGLNLKPHARAHVEREAYRLHARGWGAERIARELGVYKRTIQLALERLEKRLAEEHSEEKIIVRARQTALYGHVTQEALDAWERSKGEKRRRREVTGEKGTQEEVTTEELLPNADYLNAAMAAQERIARLWGLNAPTKSESDDSLTITLVAGFNPRPLEPSE